MSPGVQALVLQHGLRPLPVEGTLFAATYRDASGASSAMVGLYCDEPTSLSLFHRLPVDEVWHFYGGDPLRLVLLHADGRSEDVFMGPDAAAGQRVQFVVPAGCWQAGHMVAGGRYSLFGCTLAPAFHSGMFEGGARGDLLARYPQRAEDIDRLGCESGHTLMPSLPGETDSP
jgi:predicted cupin superfamily sugar epimerase